MMEYLERHAAKTGYRRVYLETHTSLQAAIHLYEKCGYKLIGQPAEAIHGAMDRFYMKEL
jgi:Acetyltransferase (GNAT) family.